jgi:hypothetical protein
MREAIERARGDIGAVFAYLGAAGIEFGYKMHIKHETLRDD